MSIVRLRCCGPESGRPARAGNPLGVAGRGFAGCAVHCHGAVAGRVFLVWEPHARFHATQRASRHLASGGAGAGAAASGRLAHDARGLGSAQPCTARSRAGRMCCVTHRIRLALGRNAARLTAAANLPDEDPVGLIHGDFQARQHFCTRTAAPAASSTGSCPPSARRASTSAALDDVRSAGVALGWRPVAPVTAGDLVARFRDAAGRRFESRMAQRSLTIASVRSPVSM